MATGDTNQCFVIPQNEIEVRQSIYKKKLRREVTIAFDRSFSIGESLEAQGLAVDCLTDNIYVAFKGNRVHVFNRKGCFLFKFGGRSLTGELIRSKCIVISKEFVYLCHDISGNLLVFDLSGNFITEIEGVRPGEHSFNPVCFAITDAYQAIYMCDNFDLEVKVFLIHYPFRSRFGKGIIRYPADIQLTKDNIYVLSKEPPYLYAFNYDQTQVLFLNSEFICTRLKDSSGLAIDSDGNFVISNFGNSSVVIFDSHCNFIHKISGNIPLPLEVRLDSNEGIIVVSHLNCIFIF